MKRTIGEDGGDVEIEDGLIVVFEDSAEIELLEVFGLPKSTGVDRGIPSSP
jgi:hypothetical protein